MAVQTFAPVPPGIPGTGQSLRAVEFFAGIGLVRLALEKQGWRVVFANDIDPKKREIYDANFGSDHFHLGDIHNLTPDDIPDCELFTASFPCNDLSIAGAWEGLSGKESSAFWGLIDLVERLSSDQIQQPLAARPHGGNWRPRPMRVKPSAPDAVYLNPKDGALT